MRINIVLNEILVPASSTAWSSGSRLLPKGSLIYKQINLRNIKGIKVGTSQRIQKFFDCMLLNRIFTVIKKGFVFHWINPAVDKYAYFQGVSGGTKAGRLTAFAN